MLNVTFLYSILIVVVLNVAMPRVPMLNEVIPNVLILSGFMLNVIVIMPPKVIMLSVAYCVLFECLC
jgi:hypothetical protein